MVKNYEYTYLTRQDMTEETAKALQDGIAQMITTKNGAVVDTPRSYKKRLAYRIKKQDAAYVNTVMFTLDTESLAAFKKETDAIADILRGLIVSYDAKKLEIEDRREPRRTDEEKNRETVVVMKERASLPAAKAEEPKKEIKPEEPIAAAKEENKEEAEITAKAKKEESETKETKKAKKEDKPKKEEKTEEPKETKPKRRAKIKTELKDIEQKLDEILK